MSDEDRDIDIESDVSNKFRIDRSNRKKNRYTSISISWDKVMG